MPPDEESMKEQWANIYKAFSSIEDYFLKDKSYVIGDQISIADLFGVCEVRALWFWSKLLFDS